MVLPIDKLKGCCHKGKKTYAKPWTIRSVLMWLKWPLKFFHEMYHQIVLFPHRIMGGQVIAWYGTTPLSVAWCVLINIVWIIQLTSTWFYWIKDSNLVQQYGYSLSWTVTGREQTDTTASSVHGNTEILLSEILLSELYIQIILIKRWYCQNTRMWVYIRT